MTLIERLNERLRPPDAPSDEREPWTIHSLDDAAYAGRMVAEAERARTAIQEWRAREIKKVEDAAEVELKRLEGKHEFFLSALKTYLLGLVASGRRTKSLDLPDGTVKLRARAAKLAFEDDDAALAWAREHGAVKVRETVDLTRAKSLIGMIDERHGGPAVEKDTGEVLPFARWDVGDDSCSFALKEPTEPLREEAP
jgi:hypothetical protein